MQITESEVDGALVEELQRQVRGGVVLPGEAGYDAARAVYFKSIDRHPSVIVRPADATDVSRVVTLARESGAELSVLNGGHSPAGHGVMDGGLVLDVSTLRSLDIDAGSRVARAGSGLTAGEYTSAAAAHGLATGFGDAPSVGIGGITLAGGIGFLHRRNGMTIDHLAGAEVVTGDGRVLRTDAETHPDLFWAIRGGGGNFGVVTRLDLRLEPVDTVLGGMLMLPVTAERLVSLLNVALDAPDELSLILMVVPAPPMPMIPAAHHGRPIMMAQLVYAGDPADGERVIAPFREAGPFLDAVRPMRYPQMYEAEGGPPAPHAVAIHTRFIDSLDIAAAEGLLEGLRRGTAPMRMAQFRPLGGAVSRVPTDATAFAHRERRALVNIGAMYQNVADAAEHTAWTANVAAGLGADPAGAYVGFLGANGAARIREAWPGATWDRLARIKATYDPTNLFRRNHNVPPAR